MTVKTAISLDDELLEEVDTLAKVTGESRSGLFSIAMRAYLREIRNQQTLNILNEVYGRDRTQDEVREEESIRRFRKEMHRRLVKGTW